MHPNDEHAYWLAGASARRRASRCTTRRRPPNTPFAYWYPPPLAQVLAPLTLVLSADAFASCWTVLLLACLWWLGGRECSWSRWR